MRMIALASHKGGTGKSTLAYNLSWLLSEKGLKVLVVDLDPQANLSSAFAPAESLPQSAHILTIVRGKSQSPHRLNEQLHVVWSDGKLATYDYRAMTRAEMEQLVGSLRSLKEYDIAFLDLPSGMRPLARAGLATCDFVVAPTDPTPFAAAGVLRLIEGLLELRQYEHNPTFGGIILNRAQLHTRLTNQVMDMLVEVFGVERFLGVLSQSVRVAETTLYRKPLHKYVPKSRLVEELEGIANKLLKVVKVL